MEKIIKALIVDDSAIYRQILTKVLKDLPEVEVVGTAENGVEALKMIKRCSPDLVTLDMEMPEMNGLETLREISKAFPKVSTVMVSGGDKHSADQTIEALGLGAIDFIVKPSRSDFQTSKRELKNSLTDIAAIVRRKIGRGLSNGVTINNIHKIQTAHSRTPALQRASHMAVTDADGPQLPKFIEVLLVGSSTGGPKALEKFIPRLPADFNIPVLIVQHMPPVFTKSLAQKLNGISKLSVKEAVDGEEVLPGNVYIAPGGFHMTVRKDEEGSVLISLNDDPPLNSCKPSVDKLFISVAEVFKAQRTISVIMTGMGSDGVGGVRALRERKGGYCISQSEKSCVVYGMPRSIVDAGFSSGVLELEEIADRVTDICHSKIADRV